MAILRYKGIRINDMQATILKSLSDSWDRISQLADVIERELRINEAEDGNSQHI